MTSKIRTRLDSILNIFVLIVLVLIIAVMVLTLIPAQLHSPAESAANVQRILAELPDAQARWRKQSITNYDIDGRVTSMACLYLPDAEPATFHVRNGNLQTEDFSFCEEAMAHLLPPAGLAALKYELQAFDANTYFIDVKFDEVYGFISEYRWGCNTTAISDCNSHITFSNFREVNR